MDFAYEIIFYAEDGSEYKRVGTGVFYPTDVRAFRLEDMIWKIAEDFNIRPAMVNVSIVFRGENGTQTPKCIEAAQTDT